MMYWYRVGPRSLALRGMSIRARPPKTQKQKHVGAMSAARFLRAQGPLWKKTKRVIIDFEAKMG